MSARDFPFRYLFVFRKYAEFINWGQRVKDITGLRQSGWRLLFDNCDIGRRAKIRRAILDKNVTVPPDEEIGYNLEKDRERYFVTSSGIVVVEGHRGTVDVATLTL